MATVAQLMKQEALIKVKVPLSWRDQETRLLVAVPPFIDWCKTVLPAWKEPIEDGRASPFEQFVETFRHFVSNGSLDDDRRFKPLNASPERYVWEMKAPDIRVFGWVPEKGCFICTFADLATSIKRDNSYDRYVAQAVLLRDQLELDDPKYVASREISDVV